MPSKPPPEPETTDEYREGREAREEDADVDSNPYPMGRGLNQSRVRWFIGWYDEKYERLGMHV